MKNIIKANDRLYIVPETYSEDIPVGSTVYATDAYGDETTRTVEISPIPLDDAAFNSLCAFLNIPMDENGAYLVKQITGVAVKKAI